MVKVTPIIPVYADTRATLLRPGRTLAGKLSRCALWRIVWCRGDVWPFFAFVPRGGT